MAISGLNLNAFPTCPEQSIDWNYRGIRIKVYKNGDQYDTGIIVVVCRKRFKHWLNFLDFLTKKLNLMAPVHEFYRTDGYRIGHFDEIEAGKSYVAVSQGPFLHKPYGLLLEEREKWNISPKFESPEQSTLDSAESVDIYLKRRGYTSRTGLPFPFDGGVCVNHSLLEFGHNRDFSSNLSLCQYRDKQKPEENNSESGESMKKKKETKPSYPRGELRKPELHSEPHTNSNPTICDTEPLKSVPETQLCEAAEMNKQDVKKNGNILHSSVAENSLYKEIAIQSDYKPTVKECEEQVPVVQNFDNSVVMEDAKNTGSLTAMQTMNAVLTKNPEAVITIVNDDALVNASNKSVIIFNISTKQKGSDNMDNINNNRDKSNDDIGSSSVNKTTSAEIPPESSKVVLMDDIKTIYQMQNSTEAKTPIAVLIESPSSVATTDRSSASANPKNQELRMMMPSKNDGGNEDNVRSRELNSKECATTSDQLSENASFDIQELNTMSSMEDDKDNARGPKINSKKFSTTTDQELRTMSSKNGEDNKDDVRSSKINSKECFMKTDFKDQELRIMPSKNGGYNQENARSPKINSKEYSHNVLIGKSFEVRRKNQTEKFEKSQNMSLKQTMTKSQKNSRRSPNLEVDQSDKQQIRGAFQKNAKLTEFPKNLTEARLSSKQQSECDHISENFGYDKEDVGDKKNQLSQQNVSFEYKDRNENGSEKKSDRVTNSDKLQESSTKPSATDKNPYSRKRVVLVTPSVDDINCEMKSKKSDSRISEEQLRSSPKRMAKTTASAKNGTTDSNSTTYITHQIAASEDVIINTTIGRKEIPKYQSSSEMSFEPDFTPRNNASRRNSTHSRKNFQENDCDLNIIDICGLSVQSTYDPDFKDFDFI